jgi:hypothetical protein
MNNRETAPSAVFYIGVTIAICGSAKMPAEGAEWSDALPMFIVGAVIASAAVWWWRSVRADMLANAPAQTAPDEDPFQLLAALIPQAKGLVARLDDLTTADLQVEVDALLDAYVLPFAEVRHRVTDKLGMQAGAEILVTLAYGERMLNRVWSAAADGHLPEARACVPEAVDALVEAQRIAAAAVQKAAAEKAA